jgi:hypothetical protein
LECKKDIIGDWGRGSKLHQKLGAKQQKHWKKMPYAGVRIK